MKILLKKLTLFMSEYFEDETDFLDSLVHYELTEEDKELWHPDNQIEKLGKDISRSLHISSQEDKIPSFELSPKAKIPDSFHINPKFLAFYKSLRKDNYYANELRDLYNSYFGTNYTKKGLAHILEIRTMFSNKRIRIKNKRLTIYTKIFY